MQNICVLCPVLHSRPSILCFLATGASTVSASNSSHVNQVYYFLSQLCTPQSTSTLTDWTLTYMRWQRDNGESTASDAANDTSATENTDDDHATQPNADLGSSHNPSIHPAPRHAKTQIYLRYCTTILKICAHTRTHMRGQNAVDSEDAEAIKRQINKWKHDRERQELRSYL